MGQKVNPNGFRVGVIKNWDSRWFVKDGVFGDTLVEDYNLRKYLKKTLYSAGVPKVEIERDAKRVRIHIHCAKPGMVIGKGGVEIEKYKAELEKMVGMPVSLNVVEVRQPDLDAQLVAENVCSQLEKRVSFRRAMKQWGVKVQAQHFTTMSRIATRCRSLTLSLRLSIRLTMRFWLLPIRMSAPQSI